MRTLEKNKVTLWVVRKTIGDEKRDADGFLTGDKEIIFSDPAKIRIPLYPSGSEIVERTFGRDASFDMISTSNDVILTENDYIFYTKPTDKFDTTYDFIVDSIAKSLNTYAYGLKARVK